MEISKTKLVVAIAIPPIAYGIAQSLIADPAQAKVGFLAIWMIGWWISEAVPLFATSALPLLILPLLGVMPITSVLPSYFTDVFFLFLGGFLLAVGVEKWKLHEYFAFLALKNAGTNAPRVILIFMSIGAFVSMWISNSAAALIMMPLVKLYAKGEKTAFHKALLLGVGYAASIGGLGTLIGSPPNALYAAHALTEGKRVSFLGWSLFSLPFAVIGLVATWFILCRLCFRDTWHLKIAHKAISSHHWNRRAIGILKVVFSVLLLGLLIFPLFKIPVRDGLWIFAVAMPLFMIPVQKVRLLVPKDLEHVPWGLLVLFGGGIALSSALSKTGLTDTLVQNLHSLAHLPPLLALLGVVSFFIIVTEFSSNTAVAAVGLPLAAPLAKLLGFDSNQMSLAIVFASSLSFMLPVATPPNAIVYGQKVFTSFEMAKVGFILNLLFAALITLWIYLIPSP